MKIFNKEFKLKALIYWLLSFLPENIHSTIDILRRYSYWKKEKTIFIHIPKGAGVSVNQAIYGRPLGHFYAKDIKRIYPKIFKKFFTFSVVRNPIDRLYSAYHFSIQGGTNVMGIKNYGYYINNQDFNSFESFVTKWLKKQNLLKIDFIFRPQYVYLFDDNKKLLVDKFYKLEHIEEYFDEISNAIGKPFSLEHLNASKRGKVKITDELRNEICNIYKQDFKLLGYSLD